MSEYRFLTRLHFAVQMPKYLMGYRIPKIEPLIYKRPLKEKLFILKRTGIKGFLTLYKFEKLNAIREGGVI